MITPSDIENKQFGRVKKGYNPDEVDDFLDLVILDMEKLLRENRQLKDELGKAHTQVDKHMSSETSVYETLEAAKSLMNDIAASAERRAEILLKNAELEADIITKEAKESIARLTEDGNRLKTKVEMLKSRYKNLLEAELERVDFLGEDLIENFEKDFMPASMTEPAEKDEPKYEPIESAKIKIEAAQEHLEHPEHPEEGKEDLDLKKTMVNIR